MDTPRLFAVLVGGGHPQANIEVHDIQFVVAPSVEAAFPALERRWWGKPASFHIDAYAEIKCVDSHIVSPVPRAEAQTQDVALYFVNTGGYIDGVFNEHHAYSFHIGANKRAIWTAARERAQFGRKHQDNFDLIDDIVCIDETLAQTPYALRFTPAPDAADEIHIVASYLKPTT